MGTGASISVLNLAFSGDATHAQTRERGIGRGWSSAPPPPPSGARGSTDTAGPPRGPESPKGRAPGPAAPRTPEGGGAGPRGRPAAPTLPVSSRLRDTRNGPWVVFWGDAYGICLSLLKF